MNEFLSMRELGKELEKKLGRKVTSHNIGKMLKEVGLRTDDGKPSQRAFDDGFVSKEPTGVNDGYFYVWHVEKTLAVLREAGLIQ